jgi:hypothetical protein
MQLLTWLSARLTGRPQARRAPGRKPTPRFRPQLETLEGRDVPSTLTVTNNLDSGPGSLRAEIAAAQSGDTIVFAKRLDGNIITLTSGQLNITTGLTIQGPGAGQLTVSGQHKFRAFVVNANQPVVLTGLTIGGEGAIVNDTTLTISACTISNGTAQYSGGGINNIGTLTVSDSTLSRNSAFYYGGGIYNAGTATLTNCTLSNNYATAGGGLFVAFRATTTLTNCTLSLNQGSGGGIYVTGFGGILNLTNTIVAGNTGASGFAPNIYGAVATADHNLVGDPTGSSGIVNGVNGNIVGFMVPSILKLGPLQNNGGPTQTMALLPGSPAIGHADNSQAPATDQRGVTRLDTASETTDIGAFELTGLGSASATTLSLTPLGTAPSAGIPVNTVPAGEVASGNVANPDAHVGRVPFKNTGSAVGRTSDVAARTTPLKSGNQKTAAVDELFAWNMSSDLFGAF